MYGTIFNIDVKPGHEEALLELFDRESPPGMLAWFLMRPDDQDADFVGVAVFESKESHIANANSPEQTEAFSQMMEHVASEPTWKDGEYVLGHACCKF
ncbi:antibiotic biosynthesis monooxygenase [Dehalococcoidia bacterium]|nr:antibiotic biosynthesis monooxygenase [Dehalococcoidia bacterium]